MTNNLTLSKLLWAITAVFAFLAALSGVLFRDMYINLFPKDFLPGAFPQDVLTLFVSSYLFMLAVTVKENDFKKQIVAIGLLGSLFYLYGIFTIERVYTWFYLLYAAVFALSFWSLIYTLAGFRAEKFSGMQVPAGIVKTTAISSIVIAIIFNVLWIVSLIPLMKEHNRIEFLYSIYILDLCFIMPAFVITAIMSLRRLPLGILLNPAIMILGFFVIFPLGLNEIAKPSFGLPILTGPMVVSFGFALFMLVLAVLQLRMIKQHGE